MPDLMLIAPLYLTKWRNSLLPFMVSGLCIQSKRANDFGMMGIDFG